MFSLSVAVPITAASIALLIMMLLPGEISLALFVGFGSSVVVLRIGCCFALT